ncbi:OB-fold domain-containing protein [Candidatus Gottesmanbacteria bacterium]|nr:OB-fold domain-containing protein [Candidatus Gottesmanbacteria bacterium]
MISPVKIWRSQKKIQNSLGVSGKIISYTRVFVPPAGFESQAPYIVVIAKLEKGDKYTAQLVDWDEKHLQIGQKIMTVLRRTRDPGEEGVIPYGIKFKPL